MTHNDAAAGDQVESSLELNVGESRILPQGGTYTYNPSTRTLSTDVDVNSIVCDVYGQKKHQTAGVGGITHKVGSEVTHLEPLKKYEKRPDFLPGTTQQTVCDDDADTVTSKFEIPTSGNNDISQSEHSDFIVDLRNLSSGNTGDVRLVFSPASLPPRMRNHKPSIACHSFILAARSAFLHRVIQSHQERVESGEFPDPRLLTIEIDWKVFSPRYFTVVVHAMYTDEVDLQRLMKDIAPPVARNSMVSDEGKDLTELILIGKFLEFGSLVQS
uniref:BTB domain-containing protein n=1 Tax=Ciona savignyi TaxID=51511 RepID=H2ZRA7_CIOSA